jgi:hypothetical protein
LEKRFGFISTKLEKLSDIKYINEASEILLMLSEKERTAMEKLKNASA